MPASLAAKLNRRARERERRRRRKLTDPTYRQRRRQLEGARRKRQWVRAKRLVLARLGATCVDCGIADHRVLTVDHLNGDGAAHRRNSRNRQLRGPAVWKRYLQGLSANPPIPLALRCFNCHAIKDLFGDPRVHGARVLAGRRRQHAHPPVPDPQRSLFA